jgi:hypothetical protein
MWSLLSRNIRFSVTLSLFVVSIVLLATIYSVANRDSVLYIIGISVSSSGISTTLVQIIAQITERIERLTSQRRFMKVFGCDRNSISNGSVAIVIPAFSVGNSPSNQPSHTLKYQAQQIVSKTSTKTALKNDVAAALHIISTFSKLGLPIPCIKWDEEINFNNDNDISTYILLGLSNNLLELIQNANEKHFVVTPTTDANNNLIKISIKLGSFDGASLFPEYRWTETSISLDPQTGFPVNDIDYALFAKFRVKHKILIICGAGTEFGTHDIGMYISENGWQQVYSELKKEKGGFITTTEAFAVTFQVPIGRQASERISIIHRCIRRVN